jgi:hypothetical protein
MHFNFNIPLRDQAELKRDEYKLTGEEIAPFMGYLESREWTPADLPVGADAWVVVGDPTAIFGNEYTTATRTAVNKLRLRNPNHVNDDLGDMPPEFSPSRSKRTSQCLALLRQTQPQGKLKVMAVNLGFTEQNLWHSIDQAESHYAKGEFGISDFELLNVLSTYPACLENSMDRGLIAGGDRSNGVYAPSYHVRNRMIHRNVKSVSDIDHGFRVATAFLFK